MNESRHLHPAGGKSPIPRIRDAREDDLVALADVLTRAFADAPYWQWAFSGSPRRRDGKLRRFKGLQIRGAFMRHLVVRTTEDCSGVAIWIPPGRGGSRMPLRLVPPAMYVLGRDIFRNLRAYRELARHIPEERHWFLDTVGVGPEDQGRHVGSLLVADGVQRAEGDGLPVILETGDPDNVGYYEHLGFELYDHYDVTRCGPPRWFFRRDPQ